MNTYYMFGDSLMRGVMPDADGHYHSSDVIGFNKMQEKYGIRFVNYAMPTFTSQRVLSWMKATLEREPAPDTAFIECGGNDCDYCWKELSEGTCDFAHRHRVSLEDFGANYREMAEYLQKRDIRAVIVIAPPIPIHTYMNNIENSGVNMEKIRQLGCTDALLTQEFKQYTQVMEEVAKQYGCEILNLQEDFLRADDLAACYSSDGLHPNEQGYALIGKKFEDFFEKHGSMQIEKSEIFQSAAGKMED